jgi:hypothetical protein
MLRNIGCILLSKIDCSLTVNPTLCGLCDKKKKKLYCRICIEIYFPVIQDLQVATMSKVLYENLINLGGPVEGV